MKNYLLIVVCAFLFACTEKENVAPVKEAKITLKEGVYVEQDSLVFQVMNMKDTVIYSRGGARPAIAYFIAITDSTKHGLNFAHFRIENLKLVTNYSWDAVHNVRYIPPSSPPNNTYAFVRYYPALDVPQTGNRLYLCYFGVSYIEPKEMVVFYRKNKGVPGPEGLKSFPPFTNME